MFFNAIYLFLKNSMKSIKEKLMKFYKFKHILENENNQKSYGYGWAEKKWNKLHDKGKRKY